MLMNQRATALPSTGTGAAAVEPPAGAGRDAARSGAQSKAHVTVRGLSKRFGKAVIYDNFDLDIPRGKLTSVFGPNGCGKSTLINMIAGLIPVDAGQILFDGKPLRAIKFGYVFQNHHGFLFLPHVFPRVPR
jgi:NitT/TauT family transport system ATP-binding protein